MARLTTDPNYLGNGCWLALQRLMQRPYWTRLWIIRETVLGSSGVVLRCGWCAIDWKTFCTGIGTIHRHLYVLKDTLLLNDRNIHGVASKFVWQTKNLHLVWKDLWGFEPARIRRTGSSELQPTLGRCLFRPLA